MKKFFLISAAFCVLLSFSSCFSILGSTAPDSPDSSLSDSGSSSEETAPSESASELTLGSTFEFDNFEITLDTEISWDIVDNRFADENGKDVIVIPITVTNLADETNMLNIFYINEYSPSGQELESVYTYFDNSVFNMGKLRSGATGETYLHLLYDGDGDYYIEFHKPLGETIEVKIPIQK